MFAVKNAEFRVSVGKNAVYPEKYAAEIAVAGKSNVGKSSLINSLCNTRKLVKTAKTPGKTKLINFFALNGEFYLVDLPGYGFAAASKAEKRGWGELIEGYLSSGRVNHILLLLDIRHQPTADDIQMFRYILYYALPYTLIATKADKLPKTKRKTAAAARAKELGAPPYAIAYSSETGEGREELLEKIGSIVHPQEDAGV